MESKTLTNYWKVYVNPADVCNGTSPSHKFRLDTTGEMTGYNGVTYYATTASESGSLPCG